MVTPWVYFEMKPRGLSNGLEGVCEEGGGAGWETGPIGQVEWFDHRSLSSNGHRMRNLKFPPMSSST